VHLFFAVSDLDYFSASTTSAIYLPVVVVPKWGYR
jgi:hypothetical protein